MSENPKRPDGLSRRELLGAAVTLPAAIPGPRRAMLKKLLPPTGVAPVFEDENLRVGTVTLRRTRMLGLFNWSDAPVALSARLTRPSTVSDFWTGAAMGSHRVITIPDMPAHSARPLECHDA